MTVKTKLLVAALLAVLPLSFASALGWRKDAGEINQVNRGLAGKGVARALRITGVVGLHRGPPVGLTFT